jgi:hypothetical protein
MKKIFVAAFAAALLALVGLASATGVGPAGTSGVTSASQITLSAGVNGGSASGYAMNQQTAYSAPSLSVGGAGTLFNQSVGGAAVAGGGTTSTLSAGQIVSTGAAGGTISAGGSSQVLQSQQNSYATQNNVKGTVQGSMALNSNSNIAAADNGGAVVSAGAGADYSATALSSRTGFFSASNYASTSVTGGATTSVPTTSNWGNAAFGLTNNSTISAGATAQAGTIVSTTTPGTGGGTGGTGGGTGGTGGNGGGCQGSGNCGVGNGGGGGNGTGNEGNNP